jgi:hypothetical protein
MRQAKPMASSSGAFKADLARRVAIPSESQNPERAAELRHYIEAEMRPARHRRSRRAPGDLDHGEALAIEMPAQRRSRDRSGRRRGSRDRSPARAASIPAIGAAYYPIRAVPRPNNAPRIRRVPTARCPASSSLRIHGSRRHGHSRARWGARDPRSARRTGTVEIALRATNGARPAHGVVAHVVHVAAVVRPTARAAGARRVTTRTGVLQ